MSIRHNRPRGGSCCPRVHAATVPISSFLPLRHLKVSGMRDELRCRKTLPNCQCSEHGWQSYDRQGLSFRSTEQQKEPVVSASRITVDWDGRKNFAQECTPGDSEDFPRAAAKSPAGRPFRPQPLIGPIQRPHSSRPGPFASEAGPTR